MAEVLCEGGGRGKSKLGKWHRSESHSDWQACQLDEDFFHIRKKFFHNFFSNFPSWFVWFDLFQTGIGFISHWKDVAFGVGV